MKQRANIVNFFLPNL